MTFDNTETPRRGSKHSIWRPQITNDHGSVPKIKEVGLEHSALEHTAFSSSYWDSA